MVRKFPPFRSERKKRSISEGTPQFPNRISGKLLYHLTSNRNFRIFSPNGKHPSSPLDISTTGSQLFKDFASLYAYSESSLRNVVGWEPFSSPVLLVLICSEDWTVPAHWSRLLVMKKNRALWGQEWNILSLLATTAHKLQLAIHSARQDIPKNGCEGD